MILSALGGGGGGGKQQQYRGNSTASSNGGISPASAMAADSASPRSGSRRRRSRSPAAMRRDAATAASGGGGSGFSRLPNNTPVQKQEEDDEDEELTDYSQEPLLSRAQAIAALTPPAAASGSPLGGTPEQSGSPGEGGGRYVAGALGGGYGGFEGVSTEQDCRAERRRDRVARHREEMRGDSPGSASPNRGKLF